MRRTFALAAFAVFAGAALTGCAPITTYSGFQSVDASPKDVKTGADTKSTVRGKLGSPSAVSTFDPNVWFYVDQVKQRIAFRRPQVTSRNVTAIVFDKDTEVVTDVHTYGLRDGKVIAYNGRETPTRGREMTILEQMLGSVGQGGFLPPDDSGVPGTRPGDRR